MDRFNNFLTSLAREENQKKKKPLAWKCKKKKTRIEIT
jgi:hypothetical protein